MNNAKKSVWMRLGVKIELTEEELRLVQESNDGTVIMMNKLKNGEFTISGDSYIPEEEGDDDCWPIPAVAASVGVVATAIETGRATTKAKHLLEVDEALRKYNEDEQGVVEEPPTKKQIALICWKAYIPAAILGGGTIACILGSNALNKKQIAGLTAAYMALGKTYQEYRRQVAEQIGVEEEKDIYKDTQDVLETPAPAGTDEEKLLCYEPISKRYFHATETELMDAFYNVNRNFALNGEVSLNDFYSFLPGLDFTPEGDMLGWCAEYLSNEWEYYWIDFNYARQTTDDGLEVYYVTAFQEPIKEYLDYDPTRREPF